jgi:hypothetical protein
MDLDGLVEEVLCAGIEGALHGLHLFLDISKQIFKKISSTSKKIQQIPSLFFNESSSLRKPFSFEAFY